MVEVRYYAFRQGLFDCNKSLISEDKSQIIVQVFDVETGEDITEEFKI